VKKHRASLEDVILQREDSWPGDTIIPLQDVPLLSIAGPIGPKQGIPVQGIQLADKGVEDSAPWLYLQFYFKTSRHFGKRVSDMGEKWLYVEANMRPALNLRIQVRAWHERDAVSFVRFLRNGGPAYDLHGPRPGNLESARDLATYERHAGDYLYLWQEEGQSRILLSAFTATSAGISVHARISDHAAIKLAEYLEEVGFTSRFQT